MTASVLIGTGILAVSVVIQVFAVLVMIRYLSRRNDQDKLGHFGRDIWALSVLMVVLFVGHLIQIGIWAKLFVMLDEFPDFEAAFYHSAVNFASLGYGDIVMTERWRLLGALEAGNGVLMFGLSAAAMFAILMKLLERYKHPK